MWGTHAPVLSSSRGCQTVCQRHIIVKGARGRHEWRELAIPERFVHVPADFPRGDPFNVGQMYALFAAAIRTGQSRLPTFDTAVDLHHFVDTIKQASDTGRELPVA